MCTTKGAIDIRKLRDPNSQGCEFEVTDEATCEREEEEQDDLSSEYFDREEVFHNICKSSILGDCDDDSDEDDCSPFQRRAKKMTDISPEKDGGVVKKVLQMGAGPMVPPDSLVFVNYNAFVEYGDEPFDSTYLRKRIKRFRLSRGEVILGLDIGVATMKKSERAMLIIKPEYGLGEMGAPPRVPKDSMLLFEVELVDFVEKGCIQDYFHLTPEEKEELTFSDVLKMVKGEKEEATKMFNINQYRKALLKYQHACEILETHPLKSPQEEETQRGHLLKLYLNLALCAVKLTYSTRALSYCTKALQIDDCNTKALYRRGQAYHQLAKFDLARETLRKACRMEPNNREIRRELERVGASIERARVTEVDLCKRMLQLSKLKDETKSSAPPSAGASKSSSQPAEEVGEKFRQSLREWLTKFREDNSKLEIEPPGTLSVPEIECLLEEAASLGLDPIVRGSGNSSQIIVRKKKEEG